MPKILLYYEPKKVPVTDKDGNIIDYKSPAAFALPLSQSNPLREKNACAEQGLSADPENVNGFRATLDLINANRNVKAECYDVFGCDDLQIVQTATDFYKQVKDE